MVTRLPSGSTAPPAVTNRPLSRWLRLFWRLTSNPVSRVWSIPASVDAGTAFGGTVSLYDAYGNLATDFFGTLSMVADDPYPGSLPGDLTMTPADGGTAPWGPITLYTAGTRQVTVTDTVDFTLSDTSAVVVAPGPARSLGATADATSPQGLSRQSVDIFWLARIHSSTTATPPLPLLHPCQEQ